MPTGSKLTRGLKRVFTHNLELKIVAFIAAIFLFSLVRGSEHAQRSAFVEVMAVLPPTSANKILVSELPDRVKLTLQGSRAMLNALRGQDIPPVQIDLRHSRPGYYYFEPEEFDVPAGVQIVQISPSSIPLRWADRIERRLSVEVQLTGSPGSDLVARPVTVQPSTVQVTGPEMEVDPMGSLVTEPIDVTGLPAGRHERTVMLERPAAHTRFSEDSVSVILEVTTERAQRTLRNIELSVVGESDVRARPRRVDVIVWGDASKLEGLERDEVVPFVDVNGTDLDEGAREVEVRVRGLPSRVEHQVVPASVLVERTRPRR